MGRSTIRTLAVLSSLTVATYATLRWLRTHRTDLEYGLQSMEMSAAAISGPGLAVDHERQPGVPPESNDDYDDLDDRTDADSFPASDPPGGW